MALEKVHTLTPLSLSPFRAPLRLFHQSPPQPQRQRQRQRQPSLSTRPVQLGHRRPSSNPTSLPLRITTTTTTTVDRLKPGCVSRSVSDSGLAAASVGVVSTSLTRSSFTSQTRPTAGLGWARTHSCIPFAMQHRTHTHACMHTHTHTRTYTITQATSAVGASTPAMARCL